jgi:hypothetical protein
MEVVYILCAAVTWACMFVLALYAKSLKDELDNTKRRWEHAVNECDRLRDVIRNLQDGENAFFDGHDTINECLKVIEVQVNIIKAVTKVEE